MRMRMRMGNTNSKNDGMLMVTLIAIVIVGVVEGELQRFDAPSKADGSVNVMVIGDWGRKGEYNQSLLARQMGRSAEEMEIDFIISTGDNFYPRGLRDANDEAFEQSFSDIYTSPSLQKTWYSVLGNHDYRGNAMAQLSPILKARDSRWFCMKSFILNADIVEFFFIDTTPFQDKYFTDPEDEVYDWRGVLPRDKYISTLLQDLEVALKESHATWKMVIGHHTIKSASIHGSTQELVQKLLPMLQENNVDFYINGHDHCLEHISSSHSPLRFLTSGAGSKAWRGVYNWGDSKEVNFFYDGQGFMTMQITRLQITINYFDIFGNVLYKSTASKPFFSTL